eukprot:TRINITY_DN1309_c0_g1_i3.p2 TRINITY_DN1309_c0_g1~~TRINITY_DN1309_c0_g1_i3.p2  ORF type:complete len:250 (+),score=20.89 TRINITY_DN1309_c0_g1_i3:1215-1964(+)
MVNHTRLSCVLASAGLVRRAGLEALHHASQRHAFGRPLINQPLMRAVLADVALEGEAAVALAFRVCHAFDTAPGGGPFGRLATAVAKYFVCKRAVLAIAEALEAHGGNGYIEDWPMARLYRQAGLNSIWEGSGNVIALDILRAIGKDPACLAAVFSEIEPLKSVDPAYEKLIQRVEKTLKMGPDELQKHARFLADDLGVALQAAALLPLDPRLIRAYTDTRVLNRIASYGGVPMDADCEDFIIKRGLVA